MSPGKVNKQTLGDLSQQPTDGSKPPQKIKTKNKILHEVRVGIYSNSYSYSYRYMVIVMVIVVVIVIIIVIDL